MKILEGEQKPDTNILSAILGCISEGDMVVDAGAWIGGYTVPMIEMVGGKGIVYAFEPNPAAFECLQANAERGWCYNVALGDMRHRVGLHTEKGRQDSGYIVEGKDVQMTRLDGYAIAPNFIKIDVEGCELKVLLGAAKTVETYRPKMVIELNKYALARQGATPQDVFVWLRVANYSWEIIDDQGDIYNIKAVPK